MVGQPNALMGVSVGGFLRSSARKRAGFSFFLFMEFIGCIRVVRRAFRVLFRVCGFRVYDISGLRALYPKLYIPQGQHLGPRAGSCSLF